MCRKQSFYTSHASSRATNVPGQSSTRDDSYVRPRSGDAATGDLYDVPCLPGVHNARHSVGASKVTSLSKLRGCIARARIYKIHTIYTHWQTRAMGMSSRRGKFDVGTTTGTRLCARSASSRQRRRLRGHEGGGDDDELKSVLRSED